MNVLLDTSFVIDLIDELSAAKPGPAIHWLTKNKRARLWISPVTLAEALEGVADPQTISSFLSQFRWQGIHHSHAIRAALLQRRSRSRMGENDAWQAAIACEMRGRIVGHDPKAFARLGTAYLDHRAE